MKNLLLALATVTILTGCTKKKVVVEPKVVEKIVYVPAPTPPPTAAPAPTATPHIYKLGEPRPIVLNGEVKADEKASKANYIKQLEEKAQLAENDKRERQATIARLQADADAGKGANNPAMRWNSGLPRGWHSDGLGHWHKD